MLFPSVHFTLNKKLTWGSLMKKNKSTWIKSVTGAAVAASLTLASGVASAADTIKVGVLHSLSGTMAISETTLKDTVLMLVEDQNKKGGLLGKKLEPVVVDPASNWPLFAEKAKELLEKEVLSRKDLEALIGPRPVDAPKEAGQDWAGVIDHNKHAEPAPPAPPKE